MITCINLESVFLMNSSVRNSMKATSMDFKRKQDSLPNSIKHLLGQSPILHSSGDTKKVVTHISADSRTILPGSLFFALKGLKTDGNHYINEAIARGAVGVVSEEKKKASGNIVYVQVQDVRKALATAAALFYNNPDRAMSLIGVTGTNGKTTVTTLVQYLLGSSQQPMGLLGTNCYDLGKRVLASQKTTPEVVDLYSLLAQIRDANCRKAVMEVSSHGIAQKRVDNLKFETVAYLNLSPEHLDYHGTMPHYFDTKKQLFTGGTGNTPRFAVINSDDSYAESLIGALPPEVKLLTFGFQSKADFYASEIQLTGSGTSFQLTWPAGTAKVHTQLLGAYNVSNLLAALAIASIYESNMAFLLEKLSKFNSVAGRMERVDAGQPFTILVDFAHTEEAMRNVLKMLRTLHYRKLWLVFGCGGDRDRIKRAPMVRVAQECADYVWATSDNPRTESQEQIFSDMKQGVVDASRIAFVQDRREAIQSALSAAKEGDCVLIAGKGHEKFQIFSNTVISFDDRQVARECLEKNSAKS